jgi:hypothetical protein
VKRLLLPIAVLVLALGLVLPMATPAMADPVAQGYKLWAGNGGPQAGKVIVLEDEDFIHVTYIAWDCWLLTETHVAVGESLGDIPQTKKGNPKVGHFPYSDPHGPVTAYTYDIERDSSWNAGTTLCIAAHAVVYNPCLDQEETAWAAYCINRDFPFPGNNWATYFFYTVQMD